MAAAGRPSATPATTGTASSGAPCLVAVALGGGLAGVGLAASASSAFSACGACWPWPAGVAGPGPADAVAVAGRAPAAAARAGTPAGAPGTGGGAERAVPGSGRAAPEQGRADPAWGPADRGWGRLAGHGRLRLGLGHYTLGHGCRYGMPRLGALRRSPGPLPQSPDVTRLGEVEDGQHRQAHDGSEPGVGADLLDDVHGGARNLSSSQGGIGPRVPESERFGPAGHERPLGRQLGHRPGQARRRRRCRPAPRCGRRPSPPTRGPSRSSPRTRSSPRAWAAGAHRG